MFKWINFSLVFLFYFAAESECTVFGAGAHWDDGEVDGTTEITLDTKVRIIRPGVVRYKTYFDFFYQSSKHIKSFFCFTL